MRITITREINDDMEDWTDDDIRHQILDNWPEFFDDATWTIERDGE